MSPMLFVRLSGVVGDYYKRGDAHLWQQIWLIPAAMAAVLIVVFAALFKDRPNH